MIEYMPTKGVEYGMDTTVEIHPTREVEDVLDLTRQYHNLLERREGEKSVSYTWDDQVIRATGTEGGHYYLQDELGSPLRLLDQAGAGMETYGYDEFGNGLYQTEGMQPFTYTGYQRDRIAGTYYAQAREYRPELGRFVSEDVVKGSIVYPFSMNSYSYCRNKPMDYVDLNGQWTMSLKLGANATLLLGVGIDIGLAFDDKGNIAIQWSYYVPGVNDTMGVGCFDAGASVQLQGTNLDTVYDLEGKSSYVGVSGGYLGYLGVDLMTVEDIADMTDDAFEGIQVQAGIGVGVDVHLVESYGMTIKSWHFDWLEKLFNFRSKTSVECPLN